MPFCLSAFPGNLTVPAFGPKMVRTSGGPSAPTFARIGARWEHGGPTFEDAPTVPFCTEYGATKAHFAASKPPGLALSGTNHRQGELP
jgi:hypothetical protein